MRQTTGTRKSPGEKLVKNIKRATTARQHMLACVSIRIGQAGFCVHFLWSRSSALAMTISFRMIAVIASFLHFPVDTNCSYFAFMSGLKRVATTAGK